MNGFLRWLTIAALIIVCFLASTVMVGLFLFIPVMVWFWWATPLAPEPAEELDDKFWSLVLWNERHGDV